LFHRLTAHGMSANRAAIVAYVRGEREIAGQEREWRQQAWFVSEDDNLGPTHAANVNEWRGVGRDAVQVIRAVDEHALDHRIPLVARAQRAEGTVARFVIGAGAQQVLESFVG